MSIIYNGRAQSTSNSAYRLLIKKLDNSIQIHNGNKVNPLNYMGPKSTISINGNVITANNKKESILIDISEIIYYNELDNWSNDGIDINGTEKQLVERLVLKFKEKCDTVEFHMEYRTAVGDIDLLIIDDKSIYHIIEAKRRKASISAVSQLDRYVKFLSESHKCVGYIVAPDINANAQKQLDKLGYKFIKFS